MLYDLKWSTSIVLSMFDMLLARVGAIGKKGGMGCRRFLSFADATR